MRERRPSPLSPLMPRLVSREAAARYAGIGTTKFDELVREGIMPIPRELGRRRLWDVRSLDAAIDDLADTGAGEPNEWDDMPIRVRSR